MIKDFIAKEYFEPSFLGIFLNPFYIARKGLLKGIKSLAGSLTGKILDVGCGTKPYEKYFSGEKYVGLEIGTTINREEKKADFYYDGHTFPFDKNEFDSIVSNQVLEHVFNPSEFLREINRVTKLGGKLLLTVPFVWDEHEQPYDYARYSSFGLKYLLEQNGFRIIDQYKSCADSSALFQLVNAYLYKIVRPIPVIKQVATIFIMSVVSLFGIISAVILPDNKDLYLDNVLLAEKISDLVD